MNNLNQIVAGAVDIAYTTAYKNYATSVEPIHLLYGLIKNPSSISSKKLKSLKTQTLEVINKLPTLDKTNYKPENTKPHPKLSQWLTQASAKAIEQKRNEIEEKDLLAFIQEILPEYDFKNLLENIDNSQEEIEVPKFLTNLNELAKNGKLDPVIGRKNEIRAVMEIASRRIKNNPVLVGEAGVGKTAVVEGLADLIVKKKVPSQLIDKTIMSLDLGALMAGTKYRGEFEERMQGLLKYIKSQNGKIILFIDEIHQLVGAGKSDGAMDAANLLKPALARGQLNCIGATTFDEYRKYILSDSALDRRFRPVTIAEPSEEDAIDILLGIKDKFEIHHGIEISDQAIFSSVFFSSQYINDKRLPDKAIDLIDEGAASLKLSAEAMPAELVKLESELRSKKILMQTEKKDDALVKEIEVIEQKLAEGKEKWQKDVLAVKRHSELKNKLDTLNFELEAAQQEGNFERASQIKYQLIPEISQQLESSNVTWKLKKEDIAKIVSRHTGIPVEKILKSKQDKILNINKYINSRVFGQKQAISEISETLIAAYAGLSDPTRPLGSFLLKGPTGVGKTETAKALTNFLFDSENNLIRLDMSEYSEKHAVAKLIGSPAGYVGYEDGGILTEAIRRKPHAVILFDEIEKAHKDFSDILLQILDDGRLTDNKGQTVSFRNTIIMMTTNSKNIELDFKPEVIGRLDATLSFNSLPKEIMKSLVLKQLTQLNERLLVKQVKVNLSEDVIIDLSSKGYDENYGARPLRALFSKQIERPLAHIILAEGLSGKEINFNIAKDSSKYLLGFKDL